jgi:hypothetical protein
VLVAYVACCSLGRTTHGFIAYYGASRLLVSGAMTPLAYNDAWFTDYVQRLTGSGVIEVFRPNPPTMALIAVPVVWLAPLEARAVWLIASIAALALASMALLRSWPLPGRGVASVAVLLLLLNPATVANVRTGQAYIFVFATLAAVALALVRRRETLAGALLGLTLSLKLTGAPLLVLLLVMRRRRAVASALVVAAATIVLVTPFLADGMWRRYPSQVWDFLQRPAATSTGYQTTRSLVRRLCVADTVWNPAPAANCAAMADLIPALLIGAALLVTAIMAVRSPVELWVAAGLCLTVLAQPVAGEPPFVLLGLPLVLILATDGWARTAARGTGSWRTWLWLAAFAVLFTVPLTFTAQRFTEGWSALAAYPRVYAAWLLWGRALWAMVRSTADLPDVEETGVPRGA